MPRHAHDDHFWMSKKRSTLWMSKKKKIEHIGHRHGLPYVYKYDLKLLSIFPWPPTIIIIVKVSMANKFQSGNNRLKLHMGYEKVQLKKFYLAMLYSPQWYLEENMTSYLKINNCLRESNVHTLGFLKHPSLVMFPETNPSNIGLFCIIQDNLSL